MRSGLAGAYHWLTRRPAIDADRIVTFRRAATVELLLGVRRADHDRLAGRHAPSHRLNDP